MKNVLRLLVLVATGLTALAATGSALAAYVPRLVVSQTTVTPTSTLPATTIRVTVPRADDATARVVIYVPLGFGATLTAAPNVEIGTVTARAQATAISPDAIIDLSGPIRTDDPARYTANPCAPGPHTAVWLLQPTTAGRTLTIPAYVDRITGGPEASFASSKITICLPSPFVPEAQGGAAFGAKLIQATLNTRGIFVAPQTNGDYTWRGVFTPYTTGTARPNAAGTVESRSIQRLPARVTLNARFVNVRQRLVRIFGSVTENLRGVAGAVVTVERGGQARGRAPAPLQVRFRRLTTANGTFTGQVRFKRRGVAIFRVRVSAPERDFTAGGCTPPSIAPAGCVTATIAGFTATSRVVTVRIRR